MSASMITTLPEVQSTALPSQVSELQNNGPSIKEGSSFSDILSATDISRKTADVGNATEASKTTGGGKTVEVGKLTDVGKEKNAASQPATTGVVIPFLSLAMLQQLSHLSPTGTTTINQVSINPTPGTIPQMSAAANSLQLPLQIPVMMTGDKTIAAEQSATSQLLTVSNSAPVSTGSLSSPLTAETSVSPGTSLPPTTANVILPGSQSTIPLTAAQVLSAAAMTSTADSSLSTANVSADPTKSSFASVATVNPITNTAVNSEMAAALQTGLKNGTGNPSGQANGADNLTTTTTTAKGSISAMVTALGGQIQQVTLPTQANAGTAKVLTQMGANPQVNSAKTQPAQSPVPIAQKADNATNNFTGQNSKEEDNSAELAEHTDSTELVIPEKAVVTTDISFAGVLNQQSVKTSQEPIATEAVETTATPNQDPNNVLGQVIQQAQLLNHSQSSQMVIKLQPEHLGEMTLKIVVNSAGGVTASFHSDNPDVRSVLQSSMTQLRQELSTQGLKVAEVGVYASLDQFNPKQQQANQQQNQTRRYNSNRGNVAASEVIEEFGSNNSFRDSGVDYRI